MRLHSALITLLLSGSLYAHADTFNTFAVNATDSSGGRISGTFTVDADNVLQNHFDITYTRLGYQTSWNDTVYADRLSVGTFVDVGLQDINSEGVILSLELPSSSVKTYTGGLCTIAHYCGPSARDVDTAITFPPYIETYPFVDGSATLVSSTATTPEPSSFALLGTGLLGIAGVVRKRFA